MHAKNYFAFSGIFMTQDTEVTKSLLIKCIINLNYILYASNWGIKFWISDFIKLSNGIQKLYPIRGNILVARISKILLSCK